MAWTNVDLNFHVTRKTPTILELKSRSLIMQLMGLFFVGTSVAGAWGAGFIQLKCQHLDNSVECNALESRLLGLVPQRSTNLKPLKGILVDQQIAIDDEGKSYPLYRLTLRGDDQTEFVFIEPTRDRVHVESIANELAEFSQTPTSQTLTIKDREWLPIFAPLFFLPVGLMLLINPLALCIFDRDRGTVTIRRYNPLRGNLSCDVTHPLSDVVGVAVEEWRDDDDTGYRVNLILKDQTQQPLIATYSPNDDPKQKTAEQIRAFLDLPPTQTIASPSTCSLPTASELLLTGKAGTFWELSPERLSSAQRQALQTVTQQLGHLGFEPLGILAFSRFSNVAVHGFAQSNGTAYAIAMHGAEQSTFAIDFYTTFNSGASLTTSTTAGVGSLAGRKLYRHSYPGSSPHALWSQHRQRVAELSGREGSPQRSEPELRSLALTMDEFFTRYPNNPLFTLSVYATQLWYALGRAINVSPSA